MECPICLNDWNSQTCVPLMLNCGHSFCAQCLTLMLPDPNEHEVKCPNCENVMTLGDKGLAGLIKNYALISLVESKLIMKNQQSPKGIKEVKQAEPKSKEKKKKKDNDGEHSENVGKSDSGDSDPDMDESQIEVDLSDSKDSSGDEETSDEDDASDDSEPVDVDTERDAGANNDSSKRSKRREEKVLIGVPSI